MIFGVPRFRKHGGERGASSGKLVRACLYYYQIIILILSLLLESLTCSSIFVASSAYFSIQIGSHRFYRCPGSASMIFEENVGILRLQRSFRL